MSQAGGVCHVLSKLVCPGGDSFSSHGQCGDSFSSAWFMWQFLQHNMVHFSSVRQQWQMPDALEASHAQKSCHS